jgi:hypothetical protein
MTAAGETAKSAKDAKNGNGRNRVTATAERG